MDQRTENVLRLCRRMLAKLHPLFVEGTMFTLVIRDQQGMDGCCVVTKDDLAEVEKVVRHFKTDEEKGAN